MTHFKATFCVSALALAAATSGALAEGKIAYFAAASQNGFNQATYEGVEEMAAKLGYETEIFDGQFDAALQYSQIEDVLAGGQFAGMIVAPNDSVGIAGAFEQVIEAGVPIGTVKSRLHHARRKLREELEGEYDE